jgi:UPF0755 protein
MLSQRLGLALIAFFVLALALGGCGAADALQSDYLADHAAQLDVPAAEEGEPVRFVVEPGTPARQIGANLKAAGLIADDRLFEAYTRVNNLATGLEAGVYVLSPAMTIPQIAEELQLGLAENVIVTIPEGWRLGQTADFLAAANVFSDTVEGVSPEADHYEALAVQGAAAPEFANYSFVQQLPAGAGLEGYLYPDTYALPAQNTQATDLLSRQLDTFAGRVAPLYDSAVLSGTTNLTLHEVVTLASIVEREAVVAEERPAIAGVYLNRIAAGMTLDADPTVQYAMGYQAEADQWWKTPVTLEEYGAVDSPYNTYLYPGLPPGPIANPGLSSIEAVLAPEQHGYLFFVALPDGSGRHVFAATFEEHQANVAAYMGQ